MILRPTRHALIFFFILGAMFLASINYQSNAAWLMVFVVFTTGCMSALHGWRNVSPAAVTAGDPPLVQAGDRARLTLTIASSAARELDALVVELPTDERLTNAADGDHHRLLVPHVPEQGSIRSELILPPYPRGIHRIRTLLVSTQYPLGLWRATRRVPVTVEVAVYPEPRGIPLTQALPDPDAEEGIGISGAQREQEDFRGLRAWQPGESPRHVDWKAAARSDGALQIKDWAGGGHGVTWLSWSATDGADETRLSQLAKWVIEAHHLALCFGVRLPGSEIAPGTGSQHYQQCLRTLAACRPGAVSAISRAPSGIASGPRPGSTASVSGVWRQVKPGKPPT